LTARRWQLLVLVAMALAAASILLSAWLFSSVAGQQDKLNAEGISRRDQNCIVFERMHQVDVIQVRSTYAYLADLSKAQLAEPINRAILAQLPNDREADAQEPRARPTAPIPASAWTTKFRKLEPEPKRRPPEVDRLLR
jgi:hypothetical protein